MRINIRKEIDLKTAKQIGKFLDKNQKYKLTKSKSKKGKPLSYVYLTIKTP